MSSKVLFVLLVVATAALLAAPVRAVDPYTGAYDGIGNELLRTFLVFHNESLTKEGAANDHFEPMTSTCDPLLGIKYAYKGAPAKTHPTMLLFSAGGQLSGFGVRAWGDMADGQVGTAWIPADGVSGAYDLFVVFRSPDMMCSGESSSMPLGDRVMVNGKIEIPLNASAATAAGWYRGNCIGKMGTHWSLNTAEPGKASWDANTYFPVTPMYLPSVAGEPIHAVLIMTNDIQYVEPIGEWEGPFIPSLYCKNFCSADADACDDFANIHHAISTMHWEFYDPSAATCENAICSL